MIISFSLGLEHYVMTGIIQYIARDLNISLSEARLSQFHLFYWCSNLWSNNDNADQKST